MARNDPTDVFRLINMRGEDDCWPWLGSWGGRSRDRRPYFQADGHRTMAYRVVWELVKGTAIPDGMMILHSCDNGGYPIGCCNPKHMTLGVHQENMDQMRARERHGLPKTAVRAIRRLLERGDTQQTIANLYGVSRETISAIATGRVYKDLGAAQPPPCELAAEPQARLQASNISPHTETAIGDANTDTECRS